MFLYSDCFWIHIHSINELVWVHFPLFKSCDKLFVDLLWLNTLIDGVFLYWSSEKLKVLFMREHVIFIQGFANGFGKRVAVALLLLSLQYWFFEFTNNMFHFYSSKDLLLVILLLLLLLLFIVRLDDIIYSISTLHGFEIYREERGKKLLYKKKGK